MRVSSNPPIDERDTDPETLRGLLLQLRGALQTAEERNARDKTIERLHSRIDELNARMWKLLFLAAVGGGGATKLFGDLLGG